MKRFILSAAVVLLSVFSTHYFPLMAAEGNADFENENNFDAYSAGNGKIHVKVLIFSERGYDYNAGRGNNQGLGNNPDPICHATGSRLHTKRVSNNAEAIYLHYWADNYYNNTGAAGSHKWPKDKGVVWVQLWGGAIECTNTYDGIKRTIAADKDTVLMIEVKRKDEGYHLTWFEFDWYPPEELDEEEFRLYVTTDHHQWNNPGFKTKTYDFGVFTGANMEQAPIISDPFFYAANDKGAAGYGKLAYVYSLTTDVKQYFTTQDLNFHNILERSDMLFVDPADTVIHGFRTCFYALRDVDQATWRWAWSNKIDIPAYHKIHNFEVKPWIYHREDIDKWYRDFRYKNLTWQIHYPQEEDIMESDFIEIQRAYNADYSDAQTIDLIPIDYDSTATVNDIQTYSYVDSTEAAWWNPVENSYTIYYRIRRTSSAVWGWNQGPYNAADSMTISTVYDPYTPGCFRNNAPFTYTLDERFETNRAVHFTWEMANGHCYSSRDSLNPGYSYHYWDKKQRLMLRKIMTEHNDTILIEIPQETISKAYDSIFYHTGNVTYSIGSIYVHYTDYANTPCTHYRYETYIDTTDVTVKNLKGKDEWTTSVHPFNGPEIYYTEAANINVFAGTDKEYPECVLLTWEPTEGEEGTYAVDARPNADSTWRNLVSGIKDSWYRDTYADPEQGDPWQYRLTMSYECNGNVLTRSVETTGRRNPYGKISGRITYADGTGCPNIEVNASRVTNGEVIQRVITDEGGYYLLDSVPYSGDAQYAITPVSQTAEFRYNNTSATFATVTLSLDHCIANGIDFENISCVRLSGRLLYENSTIPVRDANFLVNGQLVRVSGHIYKSDASGNFEFMVPKNAAFTLQAVKEGHRFAGDGFVRMEDDSLMTLTNALDGIRIYDQTKVRLIGRIAGGDIQGSKPLGHGLSTNYLGEDLKMVFELEGDNISQIVHVPSDLDKDTIQQYVDSTSTLFEKKRITVYPDVVTGEYAVDLFPVRYKITQATARGYATLFADGKTGETLDLSDAAKQHKESVYNNDTVRYNESFSITYHSPIHITCKQLVYTRELDYFGEKEMTRKTIMNENVTVPLVTKQDDGTYEYLFGAPVFATGEYSFLVTAHEDYYYNNDELSVKHEEVRIKGGKLKVYNGLHDDRNTEISTYQLKENGEVEIKLPVDYVSFLKQGEDALRVLDLSVEYRGLYVEKQALRAYVMGNKAKGRDFVTSTHADIVIFDILRDPPGSQSYAFIEEGTTYNYSYTYNADIEFGMKINIGYGAETQMSMGTYLGNGFGGMYAGYLMDYSSVLTFPIPITSSYHYRKGGTYTFKTNQRIQTDNERYFVDQTGNGKYFVGQDADVYIGAMQNVYFGITEAVKPIDSLTYAAMQSQFNSGSMRLVASGRDVQGKPWYLVIGEETEVGTYINSTFVYTHDYINNTLLPQLKQDRNNLLLTCDSVTAQAIADAKGKPVYWSRVLPTDSTFASENTYVMMNPTGDTKLYDNEVEAINRQIFNWISKAFIANEMEKVNAIYGHDKQKVGTWSVSGGTQVSHTEEYEYSATYMKRVDYPGFSITTSKGLGLELANTFGKSLRDNLNKLSHTDNQGNSYKNSPQEITSQTPTAKFIFDLTPILDFDFNYDPNHTTTPVKKTGFYLEPDNFGHESVSVYRVVNKKEGFNKESEDIREFITQNSNVGNKSDNSPDSLFGSYVYFLEGGASRCPYEPAYTTMWYEPALPLSAGTMNLENQKLDINVHERGNVPADQPAVFTLTMTNESEGDFGGAAAPITFYLKQKEGSNPHGARLIIDGMPLTGDGRAIKISHNEVINKTLQVYAGEGYDYENIVLELASPCDPYNKVACTFSVHYLPVSCPVNITTPHDKWVQNTLSSQDSVGYYLPVTIDGFDVNYNGFDHIEFQYKLSTQSDDAWVNQCSYYYDDSLYNAASGNKAMITAGRIENIRFYGERDPMEQQYDLRAVSFCRYGSGFINRSSTVLTGIKDTRPPRVFGQPEPANAILGVGDNLLLRFNEPIAGNYLDEDNNFQLTGITNETGITTGASLFFDGQGAYAETKTHRSFAGKSFSIDMLVKPAETDQDEVFFLHGDGQDLLLFGKSTFRRNGGGYDNCLSLVVGNKVFFSKPLDAPMTDFTRVIVTYDIETRAVRFYAGTKDITNYDAEQELFEHNIAAPLNFGMGLIGNLLEARVWTKALTPAEIANTHMKYLSGYERELLAYYPMNEGEGETVTDKANGATLFTHRTAWQFEKGISLHIPATDSVELAGDLMARSSIQDETLMFWFKTSSDGSLFSAASGFRMAIENGAFVMYSGEERYMTNHECTDGEWHHVVLTIDRTHNNVALFLDGQMAVTTAAVNFCSISGRMTLGGNRFDGNIDEIAVFEQALPKSFIESYAHISPYGDEMGLMAYLPFEENKENGNGIIEQIFSVNDQRQFKTSDGTVIHKIVPLVTGGLASAQADKTASAPVRKQGQLTKLNFDWSFNGDELMINLNMQDREINKQAIYVTVRDVEDLNGNPMTSPVMWTAFVDHNSLKWEDDDLELYATYGENLGSTAYVDFQIINNSGKRHQYTIESLPDWLTVSPSYGSIEPMKDKTIRIYYNINIPVGDYMDIVYLTDENGLSEPLEVRFTVKATPPYDEVDEARYPYNMSLCAQVKIGEDYDTDENDIVYAFYRNECVGMANVHFDELSNISNVSLTVHGSEYMSSKPVSFQLWQASTGKIFDLRVNQSVLFAHGYVYGCGAEEPIVLSTAGSETQTIPLNKGWTWISTYLNASSPLATLNSQQPWKEGDLIKNPYNRQFSTYSVVQDAFVGTLSTWDYKQMYMVYSASDNTLRLNGDRLSEQNKQISLLGDGQWSPLPCLFEQATPLAEALTDYYQYASPGDIVKAQNRFAYFSTNQRWEGDLVALRPGEGYLFRRMGAGEVTIRFYDKAASAPRRIQGDDIPSIPESYCNPDASTNMTIIAKISDSDSGQTLRVFVGNELVGIAYPLSLGEGQGEVYFLTVSSDYSGELRFETGEGTPLRAEQSIPYEADSHYGSLTEPLVLTPEDDRPYKIIKNGHVVIIRNKEKYDGTGKKL